jgi:hypothetical protein
LIPACSQRVLARVPTQCNNLCKPLFGSLSSKLAAGTTDHSITSSARAMSVGGTVRPSACEAQCLSRGQIDCEIEFGRLLDRQVARIGPAQDLYDVARRPPPQVSPAGAIACQATHNALAGGGFSPNRREFLSNGSALSAGAQSSLTRSRIGWSSTAEGAAASAAVVGSGMSCSWAAADQ